ncbi:Chaperone protein dnaJ 15 [Platanthera guangdongensis]|uniref:Chaperone protein dnaJ 15 n=1 Tax=Platanthera guangdongensis TaxID=2320717 RepID=A0ABR2M484_9ASPA
MGGHQQKRCLYEVLGVSRDSSQEEIRSSYRRLALQLHPDKLAQSGASGGADATAAFQELLHAYEVLSDPKERAWYDSHRSQILFSDPSSASKSRTSFFGVDLFSFFSTSVYSGYTDSRKGFFKVYGDVFAKIYAHELHFAEKLGFPSDDVAPAPQIGNLDSPYSQVTAFYSYWLGYSTVMDFTWVDEYDSFAGPNRKARRLMEEENKKARKKAKREHNDTVRGLAAFVKKRDKRVLDMQMKKKMEEEKRLADEKERKKEEERRRKEKAMMYQESEWVKNDEENEMIWDEDEEDKRKKKGEVELYCVACNKKFKSDKQWKNHEQSKKHGEKVAELRSTFDEEEFALKDIAQEGLSTSFDYEPHVEDNESSDSNNPDQLSESFRDDFKLDEEGDDNGNENADGFASSAEVAGPDDDNGIETDVEYHDLKSHRNRRNRRAKKGTWRECEARHASEEASGSQKNDNEVHEDNVEGHFEEFSYTVEEISENSKGEQVNRIQKIKKQQLDEKGHTKKDTVPQKGSSKGKKQKVLA